MSAADKNDTMKTSKQSVSCADFQDQLPDIFESGVALSEQEHLQTCEQCAALVRDLEYIAQQAKLLQIVEDFRRQSHAEADLAALGRLAAEGRR